MGICGFPNDPFICIASTADESDVVNGTFEPVGFDVWNNALSLNYIIMFVQATRIIPTW